MTPTPTPEEAAAATWRTVAAVLWLLSLLSLLAVFGMLAVMALTDVVGGAQANGRLAALALLGTALFYAGSAVRRHADRIDPAQPLARVTVRPPEATP